MKHLLKLLILLMAVFFASPVEMMAQDESPSKAINKIKRDGSYLYAEATDTKEADALEAAKVLLMIEVSEYVASKKGFNNAEQVVVKDIKANMQQIAMPRGDMIRVFIYVKKKDVEPAESVTTLTRQDMEELKEKKAEKETVQSNTAEEVAQPTAEPETSSAPANKVVVKDVELNDWQQRLAEDVASKSSMHEVKMALNKYKSQYKVKRFGDNGTPCPTPQRALYAVFESTGRITALLGYENGEGRRTDFVSGKAVSLSDYASKSLIWFTLSK